MDNIAPLSHLGLSEKESIIYLSLLSSGQETVSGVAKNTNLHRPVIYKTLPLLQNKGLVTTTTKGQRTYFVAEPPEKLHGLLQETERTVQNLIPELQAIFTSVEKRPTVKFLEGKKSIAFVFEDILQTLKKGDVFYRYSSSQSLKHSDKFLPKNYQERRDEKQLERFAITSDTIAKETQPKLERVVKTVPKQFGLFDYNITQLIYGNKIAFNDYSSETALIIENEAIANFQRQLFKTLFAKL